MRRRARAAWITLGIALLAFVALATVSPWAPRVQQVVERGVVEKLGGEASLSTIERQRSNAHALYLLRETAGLGVGLGSNRASSFLTSLLSNVGLAGTLLFLALLGMLLRIAWPARRTEGKTIFLLAACLAATLGVAIGIPDLNWPCYWILLFALLLQAPPGRPVAESMPAPAPGAPPAGAGVRRR